MTPCSCCARRGDVIPCDCSGQWFCLHCVLCERHCQCGEGRQLVDVSDELDEDEPTVVESDVERMVS